MAATDRAAGRVVSVFGGSRATETDAEYQDAYELGRLLAARGYAVCNGGYDGTMAAVSRGAKDGGGRTIGVTVEALSWRNPNRWIDEEISTATLFARLEQLATLGDAYVALRGGVGTLLEIMLVWNLLELQTFPYKPIIALGPGWRAALRALPRHTAVRASDLALIAFVRTPQEAVAHLERYFAGESVPPAARRARAKGKTTSGAPRDQ
ncbi:MAG TPA: LOG family protein [Chloroflexota bacterium]|nr:LOG family protein [Chloroflexota bacterium]